MIDRAPDSEKHDLWDRFGPRFVESTRGRLDRAAEILRAGFTDAHRFAREMHALAGEAAVLGLDEVKEIAQKSSEAALNGAADAETRALCEDAVRAITAIVDRQAK